MDDITLLEECVIKSEEVKTEYTTYETPINEQNYLEEDDAAPPLVGVLLQPKEEVEEGTEQQEAKTKYSVCAAEEHSDSEEEEVKPPVAVFIKMEMEEGTEEQEDPLALSDDTGANDLGERDTQIQIPVRMHFGDDYFEERMVNPKKCTGTSGTLIRKLRSRDFPTKHLELENMQKPEEHGPPAKRHKYTCVNELEEIVQNLMQENEKLMHEKIEWLKEKKQLFSVLKKKESIIEALRKEKRKAERMPTDLLSKICGP